PRRHRRALRVLSFLLLANLAVSPAARVAKDRPADVDLLCVALPRLLSGQSFATRDRVRASWKVSRHSRLSKDVGRLCARGRVHASNGRAGAERAGDRTARLRSQSAWPFGGHLSAVAFGFSRTQCACLVAT